VLTLVELDPNIFESIVRSLLGGLDDYTIDQRGDVGSWVRIACIQCLGDAVSLLLESSVPDPSKWLPLEIYHLLWGGLLKQGAERLDNMRAEVGRQVIKLSKVLEANPSQAIWMPHGFALIQAIFLVECANFIRTVHLFTIYCQSSNRGRLERVELAIPSDCPVVGDTPISHRHPEGNCSEHR
jgi:hypothetical protein